MSTTATKFEEGKKSWLVPNSRRDKSKEHVHNENEIKQRAFFVRGKSASNPLADSSQNLTARVRKKGKLIHSQESKSSKFEALPLLYKSEQIPRAFYQKRSANFRTEWVGERIDEGFLRKKSHEFSDDERLSSSSERSSEENTEISEEAERVYIDKQASLFDSCKDRLLGSYENMYVLFEDGKVLDADYSKTNLTIRAYKDGGMRPLFIEKVVSEPETIAAIRTPFSSREIN